MAERVVIEENRMRRWVDVWVLREGQVYDTVLRLGGEAGGTWERVPDMEMPEPTLSLPTGTLELLVAEGQGLVRHSDHVIDALADTRAVRDRLLTLVEQAATAGPDAEQAYTRAVAHLLGRVGTPWLQPEEPA